MIYSCVVEPQPKYVRQLRIWATTLCTLGGAAPGDLFVHVLDGDRFDEVAAFLSARAIPFAPMERFGDGRYCNKVAQLRSPQLRERAYAALCDTDVAFAAPLDPWLGLGRAAAKPVDGPNPPLELLERLYRRAGFDRFPEHVRCSNSPQLTFAGNCNGGLYLLRSDLIAELAPRWEKWTLWALAQTELLGRHVTHADQLGFGLAMWELGEPVAALPAAANFPLHFGLHRYDSPVEPPALLHFHDRVGVDGRLKTLGIPAVDARVRAVNDALDADERERATAGLLRVETVFGPMLAYPDDVVTRQLVEFGAHTRPELAFLLSIVRDGDRIFDLGAHIGTFAVPLARRAGPTGRVVAVEAVRDFLLVAAENAALNGLSERIELRCALVAPSDRYEAVHDRANTGATFFQAAGDAWPGEVVTIDALAAQTFVPDLIKIDVEGLEAWALTTSAVVRERKPVLYAEISARQLARSGASAAGLGDALRALGYRLFRNAGPRNAAHDRFEAVELDALGDEPRLYDVLAIHRDDDRGGGFAPG